MKHQFPHIKHINDVLPIIQGRNEFMVSTREWGSVVNYVVNTGDTFPEVSSREDAILRECRGLLFYPDGSIMSRRLHKFFNVNERTETSASNIDLSQSHVILEKLDGSMITPVYVDSSIRWGTKMGLTDVSQQAESFVAEHKQYEEFAVVCRARGITPIFEWCSRRQRIVVDYPQEQLVLIAARNTITGEYVSYSNLQELGLKWNIPVVRAYAGTSANMQDLISETRNTEGMEGWIIRFDSGHMLKIKGEWYLRIHKSKDALVSEKNVIEMLVNEKIDDVKPFMLEEDRKRIEAFESEFWEGIANRVQVYENYFQSVINAGLDRREYAVQRMPAIKDTDPFAPVYVFARFKNADPQTTILETIRKNISTQTRVNSVRHLWNGTAWNYNFNPDN